MDIKRKSQEYSLDHEDTDIIMRKRREQIALSNRQSDSRDSFYELTTARPDPSEVPIDIVGTLHKKGRLLKSWKQRYFEIQGNNMYYFKDDKSQDCLGYIDLSKLLYVGKSTAASFGAAFELQTPGRVHLLAARNEKDMMSWISVIKSKMRSSAKTRTQRGSKADVNAIMIAETDRRRATIKYNRGNIHANRKVSAQRQAQSKVAFNEEEEAEEGGLKPSQSFPEQLVNRVTTRPAGIEPSLSNYEIKSSNQLEDVSKKKPPQHLSLSKSDNTVTSNSVSGENVGLPTDINVIPRIEDLPSPEEIGLGLPTIVIPGIEDLPSPEEINFIPLDTDADLHPLQSSPAQKSKQDNVGPLNSASSTSVASSASAKSTDSNAVEELRELLETDDSHWKVTYNNVMLPSQNEPWLQEDNAIEQLRHFLRVCP